MAHGQYGEFREGAVQVFWVAAYQSSKLGCPVSPLSILLI